HCNELVELKKNPDADAKRIKRLEAMIQTVDTAIRFNRRAAQLTTAAVFLYYRVRKNSVQVAEELKLGPPHVRVLLHNLSRAWEVMNGRRPARALSTTPDAERIRRWREDKNKKGATEAAPLREKDR